MKPDKFSKISAEKMLFYRGGGVLCKNIIIMIYVIIICRSDALLLLFIYVHYVTRWSERCPRNGIPTPLNSQPFSITVVIPINNIYK